MNEDIIISASFTDEGGVFFATNGGLSVSISPFASQVLTRRSLHGNNVTEQETIRNLLTTSPRFVSRNLYFEHPVVLDEFSILLKDDIYINSPVKSTLWPLNIPEQFESNNNYFYTNERGYFHVKSLCKLSELRLFPCLRVFEITFPVMRFPLNSLDTDPFSSLSSNSIIGLATTKDANGVQHTFITQRFFTSFFPPRWTHPLQLALLYAQKILPHGQQILRTEYICIDLPKSNQWNKHPHPFALNATPTLKRKKKKILPKLIGNDKAKENISEYQQLKQLEYQQSLPTQLSLVISGLPLRRIEGLPQPPQFVYNSLPNHPSNLQLGDGQLWRREDFNVEELQINDEIEEEQECLCINLPECIYLSYFRQPHIPDFSLSTSTSTITPEQSSFSSSFHFGEDWRDYTSITPINQLETNQAFLSLPPVIARKGNDSSLFTQSLLKQQQQSISSPFNSDNYNPTPQKNISSTVALFTPQQTPLQTQSNQYSKTQSIFSLTKLTATTPPQRISLLSNLNSLHLHHIQQSSLPSSSSAQRELLPEQQSPNILSSPETQNDLLDSHSSLSSSSTPQSVILLGFSEKKGLSLTIPTSLSISSPNQTQMNAELFKSLPYSTLSNNSDAEFVCEALLPCGNALSLHPYNNTITLYTRLRCIDVKKKSFSQKLQQTNESSSPSLNSIPQDQFHLSNNYLQKKIKWTGGQTIKYNLNHIPMISLQLWQGKEKNYTQNLIENKINTDKKYNSQQIYKMKESYDQNNETYESFSQQQQTLQSQIIQQQTTTSPQSASDSLQIYSQWLNKKAQQAERQCLGSAWVSANTAEGRDRYRQRLRLLTILSDNGDEYEQGNGSGEEMEGDLWERQWDKKQKEEYEERMEKKKIQKLLEQQNDINQGKVPDLPKDEDEQQISLFASALRNLPQLVYDEGIELFEIKDQQDQNDIGSFTFECNKRQVPKEIADEEDKNGVIQIEIDETIDENEQKFGEGEYLDKEIAKQSQFNNKLAHRKFFNHTHWWLPNADGVSITGIRAIFSSLFTTIRVRCPPAYEPSDWQRKARTAEMEKQIKMNQSPSSYSSTTLPSFTTLATSFLDFFVINGQGQEFRGILNTNNPLAGSDPEGNISDWCIASAISAAEKMHISQKEKQRLMNEQIIMQNKVDQLLGQAAQARFQSNMLILTQKLQNGKIDELEQQWGKFGDQESNNYDENQFGYQRNLQNLDGRMTYTQERGNIDYSKFFNLEDNQNQDYKEDQGNENGEQIRIIRIIKNVNQDMGLSNKYLDMMSNKDKIQEGQTKKLLNQEQNYDDENNNDYKSK